MSKNKNFVKTAGTIFTLVALAHLWIALTSSVISVGGTELGSWVSWLAFIITGFMALEAFKMNR